jgi:hypothetical protein
MSWKSLIDSMVHLPMMEDVVGKGCGEQLLKDVLEAEPAIYWYPGAGDDVAALVLDMPQNPTGRRLFPLRGHRQGKPLLLWMNDYLDGYAAFPSGGKDIGGKFDVNLGKVQATVKIENSPCRFVIQTAGTSPSNQRATAIPLTIFQARVKSKPSMKGKPARYERDVKGDLYTVFYSAAESEMLLRLVFAAHRIPVEVVALIKQGGFSVQRGHFDKSGFEQYRDIPRLLTEFAPQVGQVQAYLVDEDVNIPNYKPLPHPNQSAWGEGVGARMWVPQNRADSTPQTPNPQEPSAWAQVILDTLEWKRNSRGEPPRFAAVIEGRGRHEEDGTVFTDLRQEEEDVLWRHISERKKVKVLDYGCGLGRHSDFIRKKQPDERHAFQLAHAVVLDA